MSTLAQKEQLFAKKKHQHVPKKASLSQTKELTLYNEGSQKSQNDDDLNDAEK